MPDKDFDVLFDRINALEQSLRSSKFQLEQAIKERDEYRELYRSKSRQLIRFVSRGEVPDELG
jgi:hypothetical protein